MNHSQISTQKHYFPPKMCGFTAILFRLLYVGKYFRNASAILCVFVIFFTSGCTRPVTKIADPVTVSDFKLNTYVSISGYTSNATTAALKECLNLCDTYEHLFSRTLPESTLYQVNHRQTDMIPAELATLIQYGIDYGKLSDGAFDITIGSVSSLWDFTAEHPQVPEASAIADALQYVDYTAITLTPTNDTDGSYRITMPEHTMIDLGAIAKGYIADRIKDALLERGITSAVINLGGNVLCVGSKQHDAAFTIGIRKPFSKTEESLTYLGLKNKSSVSSGTYERYFEQNGNFYHHILNPATGYPYNNNLTGVTILSDESVTGDCLSTTCFALGLEKGLALIEDTQGVEALFITADGTQVTSSGWASYEAN